MPTLDQVTEYVQHMELALHRAPSTVRGYREELESLVERGVPLEPTAIATWVSTGDAGQPLAPNTKNRRLVILRGFLAFLVGRGDLSEDLSGHIKRARVPRPTTAALGVVELVSVLKVIAAGRATWRRSRDATILLVLFQTGLRISELRNLNLDQVDLRTRVLWGTLRKGGALVDVPLNDEATLALSTWLRVRPVTTDNAVFVGGTGLRRLSVRILQRRLAELGQAACYVA